MDNYRVFISYSHEDLADVEKIVAVLEKNGLRAMWDRECEAGRGFQGQIKNYIEHAHVFMPFITEASNRRGWVHQEIGYAKALNIPVLPLTKDRLPGELLQDLQAVPFSDDPAKLAARLNMKLFDTLVFSAQQSSKPLFYLAEDPEDRTMMMVDYATKVVDLGNLGEVRQKGGLSSFNIPNKIISDRDWHDRYGKHYKEFRCKWQLRERQSLEKHVRADGCSLIVDPRHSYKKYGPKSKPCRLRTLISFLETMDDARVRVAVAEPIHGEHHLTIVGDWFASEAVKATMGTGIRHTIFTRHGPSVRTRIQSFDEELAQYLREQGIKEDESRSAAISKLRQILETLER